MTQKQSNTPLDGRKKPRTQAQLDALAKARETGGRKPNDDPATVKRSRTVSINYRTELLLLEKTGCKSLTEALEFFAQQYRV